MTNMRPPERDPTRKVMHSSFAILAMVLAVVVVLIIICCCLYLFYFSAEYNKQQGGSITDVIEVGT